MNEFESKFTPPAHAAPGSVCHSESAAASLPRTCVLAPDPADQLAGLLESALSVISLENSRYRSFHGRLKELRERLTEGRFHLAVLGQFKRGKSTLLNALLGEEIVPVAVIPLTAIPTLVRFSANTEIHVVFNDGRRNQIQRPEIADYVTEERNPRNGKQVKQVEIGHPSPLLSQGLVLIDTPGIGSTFTHNSRTTMEFLPRCDAALFLVSADPPMTETEQRFLRTVRTHVDRLFFVLNKVDYLDEGERREATRFLLQLLHEQPGMHEEIHIYPVSARQGLQSKLASDASQWRESGLQQLERDLLAFGVHEKREVLQRSIAKRASDMASDLLLHVDLERRSLELPTEDLEQRMGLFKERTDEIGRRRQDAADTLLGDQRRTSEWIDHQAQAAHDGILRRLHGWMNDFFAGRRLPRQRAKMESDFHQHVEALIPEVFDETSRAFFEQLRQYFQQIIDAQIRRSSSLLKEVRQAAAQIFEIPHRSFDFTEALPRLEDAFWETIAWSGRLGIISPQFLERFLPPKMRRQRREARLRNEVERLVAVNIESLRWNAIRQVDDAFRLLTRESDLRFRTLIEGTRGALDAAGRKRRENADAVRVEMAELQRLGEFMRAWTAQLEALNLAQNSK